MTPQKAKTIFATHMQAARKRKLTEYEAKQLTTARQVLRGQKKSSMNPVYFGYIRKKKLAQQTNPKPVIIYGKVTRIEAQKTQKHICDDGCKRVNHRYFHNFTSSPTMYGLPDGSLLIK